MKIQEFLEKNKETETLARMDRWWTSLWAKKFSEVHLPTEDRFSGTTLCEVPMLGNNYAVQAVNENRDVCKNCLKIFKPKPITVMEKTEVKKPKVKLSGQDGNVFGLIGLCSKALKKAGQAENAEKMTKECFASGSYDEALQIMMKYCDVD